MFYDLFDAFDDNFREFKPVRLPINLKTGENCYEVDVALPGYKKEEISILPTNNGIKVCVDKKDIEKDEHLVKEFCRTEHAERTITFAKRVDLNNIKAKFDNGVLHICVALMVEPPKIENKIEIE